VALLAQKGSLYLTRPTLFTYAATRDDLLRLSSELFAFMESGKVVTTPRQTFALEDAAAAHRALESRNTTGASVLLPH
jgi:NADPH2:quinone reductase